jgi:hypothetical protein
MVRKYRGIYHRLKKLPVYFTVICILTAGHTQTRAGGKKLKIFDGKPKIIVVNGYSTSFQWPRMLQRKLDRYLDGKRTITVKSATRGGTPIAQWLDVKTGRPLGPWLKVLRPALRNPEETPVIVLAQQSLQWVYDNRRQGIRSADDKERCDAHL